MKRKSAKWQSSWERTGAYGEYGNCCRILCKRCCNSFIQKFLRKQELKDFYQMMPEKFNNKTNGITQRRFLAHGNPLLADWITDKIGDGWITDLSQIAKAETTC